ncbi:MAG TPA: hypothetical protein VIT91_22025 [Chthoniobacterales bacterium]
MPRNISLWQQGFRERDTGDAGLQVRCPLNNETFHELKALDCGAAAPRWFASEVWSPIVEICNATTDVWSPIVEIGNATTDAWSLIAEIGNATTDAWSPIAEIGNATTDVWNPIVEICNATAEGHWTGRRDCHAVAEYRRRRDFVF